VQDNYQILFFGLDGDRRSRSVQIKQVEMDFLQVPRKISPKPYTWRFSLPRIRYRRMSNIPRATARLLSHGAIIGWFQGRPEFGPRALGNRSILADPRRAEMKDILNSKVKHREAFRPFAPSVLKERAHEFFILEDDSPFMLLAPPVRKEAKELIPAVVHVDGTARVQTVTRRSNPIYYDAIKAFGEITGIPIILNTSFNIAGDPIVETPLDALQCFFNTKMDYVVLHNYLIWKADERPPGM
jgi:carbamoyltransferase